MTNNLQTLQFDSDLQLNIFFLLLNHPKGLERREICKKLNIKWTTAYDNLEKLEKRKYIAKYSLIKGIGHPIHIWFILKSIKNTFYQLELPKISVENKIINS